MCAQMHLQADNSPPLPSSTSVPHTPFLAPHTHTHTLTHRLVFKSDSLPTELSPPLGSKQARLRAEINVKFTVSSQRFTVNAEWFSAGLIGYTVVVPFAWCWWPLKLAVAIMVIQSLYTPRSGALLRTVSHNPAKLYNYNIHSSQRAHLEHRFPAYSQKVKQL